MQNGSAGRPGPQRVRMKESAGKSWDRRGAIGAAAGRDVPRSDATVQLGRLSIASAGTVRGVVGVRLISAQ
jgi:hypothetical protein